MMNRCFTSRASASRKFKNAEVVADVASFYLPYVAEADTTIRLYHIGKQRFGWEDAGIDRQRYPAFTLHLEGQPELLKRD